MVSVICIGTVSKFGMLSSEIIGWQGLGFSIRLDPLSVTMFTMISILGFVIVKYSFNYLDGDHRRHLFLARLATTLASVELLVISGNLAQLLFFWFVTSVCLHYLLVFYRNRPQAIAAARKKFFIARLSDFSLLASVIIIYAATGTGELNEVFLHVESAGGLSNSLVWATILLAISAILKSAQFPTHGWLIEVVETPTPVSALLHAGLLNAGPFLMVRMSNLMVESIQGSLVLIVFGGVTALLASIIYLTQSTIKVSLGYSSIAHMGFSLLICGFGIYSAALLHVVAHSFYKAHAFLSSGSEMDSVRARKVKVPKRMGSVSKIGLSIFASLGIFVITCNLWGIDLEQDFTLMVTGAIIVMGITQMIASAIDARASFIMVLYTLGAGFLVTISFFSLEQGFSLLLGTQIPQVILFNATIKIAALIVLLVFFLVILVQLFSNRWRETSIARNLGVHLRNGLYANVLFDRMIGSLKHEQYQWANLSVRDEVGTDQGKTFYPSSKPPNAKANDLPFTEQRLGIVRTDKKS